MLRIFADENVLEVNRAKAEMLNGMVRTRAEAHPRVGEYRQLGMVGALELTADRASKAPFDWRQRVGYHIYRYALEGGVLLRPLGNVIYFMPPYVVEEEDLAFLADTAFASLDRYFEEGPYR